MRKQLKRPRDAAPGDLVRLAVGDVLAAKADHAAGVGRIDAGDQIEQGALAGAVRADDAVHLALGDRHLDVRQGDQPAEALGEARDLKQQSVMLALAAALPVRSATKRRVASRRSI